jgi:signal transduction histidine kinase/Fe-S-cluster-containing hydrogenase component 2
VPTTQPRCFTKTVKDRCRVCYTCVRRCPAKAIRIMHRQAEVVPERCIGCGNCVLGCSQGAKEAVTTCNELELLLGSGARVAACVAPSFPAEFAELADHRVLVGMLRELGFDLVTEVAFGADLVAKRYRQLMADRKPDQQYIATTCPAVVGYVERYFPALVPNLAPIVSPMVAMARALRALQGADLRVAFIGPCIAKKVEGSLDELRGDVDVVITFRELRQLLAIHGITPDCVKPSDFDPPRPGLGAVFPLSRGILQAAGIQEDLLTNEVVAAGHGVRHFVNAIDELAAGDLETGLLEILSCNGCIMGPGMSSHEKLSRRHAHVTRYASAQLGRRNGNGDAHLVERLAGLDLSRTYRTRDQRLSSPSAEEVQRILLQMGKDSREDELDCGACGYPTCREHAVAIYKGLAESRMCLPYVIDRLNQTVEKLFESHSQLEDTQEQLMHSERLATMGQLAAGVAHELNNPLGVVLMYAHLLLDEMGEDAPLYQDLRLISEQADRCKRIVSDLLDFARESKLLLQEVEVRDLVDKSLKSVPIPSGVRLQVDYGHQQPTCEVDSEQMMQVFTNLYTNAFAAMADGGQLSVETSDDDESVTVAVRDTGVGIPRENLERVFRPFFTTKRIGKGTGLGLAVVYGIVKMHRGQITVESNSDPTAGPTGTTFRVTFPRQHRTS